MVKYIWGRLMYLKAKEYGLSIIFNAFLAYVWLVFSTRIVNLVNTMNNPIMPGLIIGISVVLFFEIARRVTPFNEYKINHPINIKGISTFIIVIAVLFIWELI